ncbi:hypothetical protein [Clostridium beijerinckii]|uniref:Uncharacterized protein n=1 Tax=Clostridium beijerinckii TaxID=1520 RepID=A0AAE5LN91_CLOBE|nr:hypothetical protein [Clostridium beijerinckii]NSB12148.1 hypothetical protein [Clostridium beijerinckii]OOM23051.1 hypothetical protein CLOBE_42120 [Clostridium beijerinckii]
MDNDNGDVLTKLISKSTNFLLINNPKATSMGVLFGVFLCNLGKSVLKYLEINFELSYWICMPLTIVLFNIPNLFRKHDINPEIETMMNYVKKAQKEGNFTASEKRQQWRNVVETINKSISIENNSKNQLEYSEEDKQIPIV